MPILSLGFSDLVLVPSNTLLGRTSAGTGPAQALVATSGIALGNGGLTANLSYIGNNSQPSSSTIILQGAWG